MKTLGSFINKKTLIKTKMIDEKSVFYVFGLVIKEEYGKQGFEHVTPVFFRDRKIFIRTAGDFWESEILLNKANFIGKINRELGGNEVMDLAMYQ